MALNVIRVPRSHLWAIQPTQYSPKLKHVARSIPGMVWDSNLGHLGAAVGYVDAVDATVTKLGSMGIRCNRGDLPDGPTSKHQLPAAYAGLRDYQKTGVDFLIANGPSGVLLSDMMGLGKSATSLRAARAFRQKTIIVCLSFARSVWWGPHDELYPSQIEKFWPEVYDRTQLLAGVKEVTPIPQDIDVVVVHFDIIYAWVEEITKWVRASHDMISTNATIIIDEIHACASPKARRSQVVRDLAHSICSVRIGLSGTPMTNRPRDLWFPLEILSPGRFGSEFFLFGLRFCAGRKEEIEMKAE